jgi:hypothetical protein
MLTISSCSRECYCGLTLSNDSTPVEPSYCSSPCPADLKTSCGGYGFLTLYELRSSINSTTSSMTSTSSPTPTASHTAKPKGINQLKTTGMWIGIGFGLAALAGILALLLWWEQRRYNTRKRRQAMEVGTGKFIGGYKLEQERPRNYAASPGTDDGRRNGFIGESNLYNAPPLHEVQSEESGRRHREAFSMWKIKAETAKTGVENSLDTPVQTPTEVFFKSPGMQRRRTFDEWKTGVVRPLSSEPPQDMREPIAEENSLGGSAGGAAAGTSSTSNWEEPERVGEQVDGGNLEETSANSLLKILISGIEGDLKDTERGRNPPPNPRS